MIDLKKVEAYRENNRIEAKRALGGLPYSVWETYSSFANTMGGVILLGVEEGRDKSFHALDLPSPERLVERFWRGLNDRRRVNVNILLRSNVYIARVEGKRIVVIEVPRAHRADRPVYIENDVWHGTYRRGGEGDYRCTPEEIAAMQRDAAARTQDMQLLVGMGMDALCKESIASYRERMEVLRPGHALLRSSDRELLIRLNAAGTGEDGVLHPTAAGLLTFGHHKEILSVFPQYRLTVEEPGGATECRENLYTFYQSAERFLDRVLPRSAVARTAASEALCNALVNADYREKGGVSIERTEAYLRFSNPGGFRVDPALAKKGGVTDARNKAISHIFTLIGIGAGVGGGIPRMQAAWRAGGRPTPYFSERFSPERTILTLPFQRTGKKEAAGAKRRRIPSAEAKQLLAEYLTQAIEARAAEISAVLGVSRAAVLRYLGEMRAEGTVTSRGQGRNTVWRLLERATP